MVALSVPEQVTAAQHERLVAELAELEGPARAEIVEAIRLARGHGDLSENFEYQTAKDEQALLERRITILRAHLEAAVIVEVAAADAVAVGTSVTIEDDDGEQLQVEMSNLGGAGTVSTASPLGKALLGRHIGDTVRVEGPRRSWKARILAISVD